MLSLVLPTYNEAPNIQDLLPRLRAILAEIPHEILVVDDDSPDLTWEVVEQIGRSYPEVHAVRRRNERGLSSAVVEGFSRAKGEVLVVMDADGQHDPAILPALYTAVQKGAPVAIASRYIEGGSVADWRSDRRLLSRLGTWLARAVLPVSASDPMSGYFAVKRGVFLSTVPKMRPKGFKILFELLSLLPAGSRIAEVPMTFGLRTKGESKLSMKVQLQYAAQLLRMAMRRLLSSIPWVLFAAIILIGAIILLPRVWDLRRLYRYGQLRSSVERAVTATAIQHGWLVSDISIDKVEWDHVQITHREHLRGRDPVQCYRLTYDGSPPVPCAD